MRTVVIGLGNPMRGDDAAGLAVAERLADLGAVAVAADPLRALEMWSADDHVILVDAMRSGAAPGTVTWFAAGACGPAGTYTSSHAVGPVELIGLAEALGRMPARLDVVGVEVGTVETGDPMSSSVVDAVERLATHLAADLATNLTERTQHA